MSKKTGFHYEGKPVDSKGEVQYTPEENLTWHDLYSRQYPLLQNRACQEYLRGIELLHLSKDNIPQCPDVSKRLQAITGWTLEPVKSFIPYEQFFYLLANRKFPAATFIRRREEIDYLEEPDIFHEVFGHCPLLTNQAYADFAQTYGKLGMSASEEDRVMLARLYWFTIEFGLIQTPAGLRIYGGGILSSKDESVYCLDSDIPQRKPFDVIDVLRTPFRIDIMQPTYFIINNFDVLFSLIKMDLIGLIQQAKKLGMHKATFPEE